MNEYVEVTQEVFDDFIWTFPRILTIYVTAICEPPMKSYNDFSGGLVWPQSVVAKVQLFEDCVYGKEPNKYFIRTDFMEME